MTTPKAISLILLRSKHRSINDKDLTSNVFLQITSDETLSLNSSSSAKDSGTGESARRDGSGEAMDDNIDYEENPVLSSLYSSHSSGRHNPKSCLHKGVSMDQISAKRKAKRHDSGAKASEKWTTFSPIKSYSVNDMLSVTTDV